MKRQINPEELRERVERREATFHQTNYLLWLSKICSYCGSDFIEGDRYLKVPKSYIQFANFYSSVPTDVNIMHANHLSSTDLFRYKTQRVPHYLSETQANN